MNLLILSLKINQQNLISLEKTYKTKFTKYLCPNILEDDLDLEKAINLLLSIRKSNINTKLTIKCELFFLNCCKDFILNYARGVSLFGDSSVVISENFFKDGTWLGVNIKYTKETKRLGTAGALSLIDFKLESPFIVVNGDVLTSIDFEDFLDFHNVNSVLFLI